MLYEPPLRQPVRGNVLSGGGDSGVSSQPQLPSVAVRRAVDIGQSFADNVTTSVRRDTGRVASGTPEGRHAQFQRAREGVDELNRLALVAAEAFANLDEPGELILGGGGGAGTFWQRIASTQEVARNGQERPRRRLVLCTYS